MSTIARVATICQNMQGTSTIGENRISILDTLDRALLQEPDIVCLPETFSTAGVPSPNGKVLDEFPGPTTDAVADKGKRHGCYIICPVSVKRGGRIYNSAIVFDRSGAVLGVYDKFHPVTTSHDYTEFESGTTPGSAPAVFDLDFGRIGIQICFDAGFPESWAALAQEGAKLVFWPSAYLGGFPLQAYACLHKYYVVSSVRADKSRIINPCGRIVAETDSLVNIATFDLNLDFAVCHYDFNYDVPDRIMDAYGRRVRVASYEDDPHFLVEPIDQGVTIRQLQREFGFENANTYYDRHRKGHQSILQGQVPQPQLAAHDTRSQYVKE